tara:strand:- start:21238 stop:21804 length:567 start_codon:yes stop_codon:yes gene_type:complete
VTEQIILIAIGFAIAVLLMVARRRLAEFHGQKPEDYIDAFPQLDLQERLRGKMVCEGVIFGPVGRVTSTFVAQFSVVWDDRTAIIDEEFRYNNGTRQTRQWTVVMGREGHFTCTAPDVVGKGMGVQAGPTVQLCYRIRLPKDLGGHVLDTVDWMYLTPDGTIVNRSQFRKFGFKVAELVATIRPKDTM